MARSQIVRQLLVVALALVAAAAGLLLGKWGVSLLVGTLPVGRFAPYRHSPSTLELANVVRIKSEIPHRDSD